MRWLPCSLYAMSWAGYVSLFLGAHNLVDAKPPGQEDADNLFTLRHIVHQGVDSHHRKLLQRPIPPDVEVWVDGDADTHEVLAPLRIERKLTAISRVFGTQQSDIDHELGRAQENPEYWRRRWNAPNSMHKWAADYPYGPDFSDRETVINFALMAANAYTLVPGTKDWEDLDNRSGLNRSLDFGWEAHGLRGHVFADSMNTTIVIAIKGTSRALYDGDETTTADKENDNLFFSCCCAQQGQYTWRQVCGCGTSTYGCNQTCLVENLQDENRYYSAAKYLYRNVTQLYPNANVWLTGHSLGGTVSSLLGLTYGLPTITFEAPPNALAASRLGLPVPANLHDNLVHGMTNVVHFGHTADPLFMGNCNGATASCSWYGYAFESQCHSGEMCTYDTVGDLGWRAGVWTHGIREVIRDVLRKYDELPDCIIDNECVDCYNWNFYHSNHSVSTTSISSISSRSRSRTATCQTPGWWGCRDEKTTSTTSSTSATATTTRCHTPGWFGCDNKPTSTTTSLNASGAHKRLYPAALTT